MARTRWLPSGAYLTIACCLLVGAVPAVMAADPQSDGALPPPAGQVCPPGAYVRGFDTHGNILCTGSCGDGVLDVGEGCDDGNLVSGDGCSHTCQPETTAAPAAAAVAAPAAATAAAPAAQPAARAPDSGVPVIDDIKPWSVVYGTRETTLTITGAGFGAGTVVLVAGEEYQPSVSADGTRLEVTITTRHLIIGSYPIKVSNAAGQQVTRKRGLVIY